MARKLSMEVVAGAMQQPPRYHAKRKRMSPGDTL